jgi:hypothetical protein
LLLRRDAYLDGHALEHVGGTVKAVDHRHGQPT